MNARIFSGLALGAPGGHLPDQQVSCLRQVIALGIEIGNLISDDPELASLFLYRRLTPPCHGSSVLAPPQHSKSTHCLSG